MTALLAASRPDALDFPAGAAAALAARTRLALTVAAEVDFAGSFAASEAPRSLVAAGNPEVEDVGSAIFIAPLSRLYARFSDISSGGAHSSVDCVAGLDWIVEEIEDGYCRLHSLLEMRGWKP